MDEMETPSDFVVKFRSLPIREREIMFALLFTDRGRLSIARDFMVTLDRLDEIEKAAKKRLGLR
jgi:hypothetical protein